MEKLINRHTSFSHDYISEVHHANITAEVAVGFANWIRNEINEDRLRHYDPTINGKWAYWPIGGGGIAKQLTTQELFNLYLTTLK